MGRSVLRVCALKYDTNSNMILIFIIDVGIHEDPSVLEKAHVVITTYATAASEYNTYKPDVADESNSKSKHKKKFRAEDYSDDDSESDSFGSSVKKSKKSSKKKNADALFRVKWWRIVLGNVFIVQVTPLLTVSLLDRRSA